MGNEFYWNEMCVRFIFWPLFQSQPQLIGLHCSYTFNERECSILSTGLANANIIFPVHSTVALLRFFHNQSKATWDFPAKTITFYMRKSWTNIDKPTQTWTFLTKRNDVEWNLRFVYATFCISRWSTNVQWKISFLHFYLSKRLLFLFHSPIDFCC